MELRLENRDILVNIKTTGAELCGIQNKNTGIQYIWQPGKEIWDHSSLLLFPNPGRVCRDRIFVNGKVYPATMHGFLTDREFEVIDLTTDRAVLRTKADKGTRKYFPYAFQFVVSFLLEGTKLIERIEITDEDDEVMFFSFGAHPGFYLPLVLGESGDDYQLKFDVPQQLLRLHTQPGSMLLTNEETVYLDNEDTIQLHENFFDEGPVLLKNVKADSVTLISQKSSHYVKLGISGFPYMCLWGNPKRNAVICVEPWCGISDHTDCDHVWEHKEGIQSIKPGETFCRDLTFVVG